MLQELAGPVFLSPFLRLRDVRGCLVGAVLPSLVPPALSRYRKEIGDSRGKGGFWGACFGNKGAWEWEVMHQDGDLAFGGQSPNSPGEDVGELALKQQWQPLDRLRFIGQAAPPPAQPPVTSESGGGADHPTQGSSDMHPPILSSSQGSEVTRLLFRSLD